jgi:hypothetical protein
MAVDRNEPFVLLVRGSPHAKLGLLLAALEKHARAVLAIKIGQTVRPEFFGIAVRQSSLCGRPVERSEVTIGCLSFRVLEPFEVSQRPNTNERFERYALVAGGCLAEHD